MTQEATSYKIWKPEHDGHAPPNWREGMGWRFAKSGLSYDSAPKWIVDITYLVPAEALNSPNDDASGDVDAWRRNEAPIDKRKALRGFIQIIKDYPPEMLAEEGITLAPEKDWATELWAETFEVFGKHHEAARVRNDALDEKTLAAIQLLRTRFEQMKGEG